MLSIVIPVLNESESLETLHRELCETAAAHTLEFEAIFVDDGSKDGSWETIRRLAAADPRVRGIRFRRNFGKSAALNAGFAAARGELIMTLDADLQDDPREIPRFLAEMEKQRDVVSGWKKVRRDPWHKVWASRLFNWTVSATTGVVLHDHNCGMKCYRREIFDEVRLYGELHRFVPVLAAARGFRVGEVVVNHRPRIYGRSKYGPNRFVKGFLDLLTVRFLTGFGQRPQHMLGAAGLASFVLGLLGIAHLLLNWILAQAHPGWRLASLPEPTALLLAVALMLLGGQLMSMGFLAELILAYHAPRLRPYSIVDEIPAAELGSPSPSGRGPG